MAPATTRKNLSLISITAILCLFPEAVNAGSAQEATTEGYFRMIWGLLIVLGIIFVLYSLLKKRFSLLASSPEKSIQILEIKPLMGRKALCLVSVRGNEFLIGISGDRINHIATLPGGENSTFAQSLRSFEKDRQT